MGDYVMAYVRGIFVLALLLGAAIAAGLFLLVPFVLRHIHVVVN